LGWQKHFGSISSERESKMQRQDSTYDQLKTVYDLANKAGCYDAADAIKRSLIDPIAERLKKLEQEGRI
jgi:hypothetical protein